MISAEQQISGQQPVPGTEPDDSARWRSAWIYLLPSFQRGAAGQILVCSNRVVPKPEQLQCAAKFGKIHDLPAIELGFEGPEQSFDPAVLPGAADLATLMANPQDGQASSKHSGGEDRCVVAA